MGEKVALRCRQCGHQYEVAFFTGEKARRRNIPTTPQAPRCPKCRSQDIISDR